MSEKEISLFSVYVHAQKWENWEVEGKVKIIIIIIVESIFLTF